jgi:hypothetical protein
MMGGVMTEGLIGNYCYGYRKGFTAEIDAQVKRTASVYGQAKSEWFRREALKAGAEIWYGSLVEGAVMDGSKLVGVIVVMFDGTRGVVRCKRAIDATGNADLAALAVGSTTVAGDDYGGFLGQATFSGAAGDSVSAYVVIFDGASVDSSKNMYISEVVTATAPSSGVPGMLTFGEGGDMVGMASAGAWTASAVPEPTSGLLLLLGVAGIALKRKRA